MLTNSINPVLFHLGMFQVRYYGIIFAAGFIIVYYMLLWFTKKRQLDYTPKELDDFLLYLVIGVVAGARFFEFVFYHPSVFFTDPLEILKVWHGGLSFHGGFIGAVIAVILFCKRKSKNPLELMDALVVPSILALAFGRLGNFTNSELYGPPTDVSWCVQFTMVDDLCRHPYQIYASLSHLLLFTILLYTYARYWQTKGVTFVTFLGGYGALRVITDFFREEPKYWLGLSTGQWLCAAMIVIALAFHKIIIVKRKKN